MGNAEGGYVCIGVEPSPPTGGTTTVVLPNFTDVEKTGFQAEFEAAKAAGFPAH